MPLQTPWRPTHARVVTRYVGSGIKGVGSRIRRMGSKITALGSGISDHGIGISSFLGIRDQAASYLWDQRRKWVTLLGPRIRNLRTKMGSAKKKHTSLPPWHAFACFLLYLLSVSTLRRLFNLLANSHIPPTTRNARSTTEERVIIVLYIEASLSTKPVDLSTARGIGDSWKWEQQVGIILENNSRHWIQYFSVTRIPHPQTYHVRGIKEWKLHR